MKNILPYITMDFKQIVQFKKVKKRNFIWSVWNLQILNVLLGLKKKIKSNFLLEEW